MSTPSGPFTVRPWLHGANPGGVVVINEPTGLQVLNTTTLAGSTAVADAILAAANPTPPPPAAPTVQFARVAIASAAAANLSTPTPSEGVIIAQAWEVATAKAANPAAKVLLYFNLGAMTTGGATDGLYPAVPLNSAYSLDVEISGYTTLTMADVGSPAYRTAWVGYAIYQALVTGADGVFADNTDLVPSGPQTTYSDAEYQIDVGLMLAVVCPAFKAAGVLLVPNFGSASTYPEVAISWLPNVDGFMDEQFLKWGTVAGAGYRSALGAMGQLNEAAAAAAAGKIFIGVTHSADGDQAAATYGLATMLLTGGTYCFSTPPEYATESLAASAPLVAELGAPSGAYTGSNGVYQRQFAGGSVSVNMTTSPPTGTITPN